MSGMNTPSPLYLSDDDLEKLLVEIKKHVSVSCDEYHAHSVECLIGKPEWLSMAKLHHDIVTLRSLIRGAANHLSETRR